MPTVFLRTLLLYFTILFAMRLMGKRQLGQMELSELVTVTMLSELASYTIMDSDVPIFYSIVPVAVLVCLEVTISFLTMKSRLASRLFDGTPSLIINDGVLDQKELRSSRLTLGEMVSALRCAGLYSISDCRYFILEPGGKISVVPKRSGQALTPEDLGLSPQDPGIEHALILDGNVIGEGLRRIGKDRTWLWGELSSRGLSEKEVFYMACDDAGRLTVIRKEPGNSGMGSGKGGVNGK